MKQLLVDIGQTFLPSHWAEICQRTITQGLKFLSKVLLLAFVLMLLLSIPSLLRLPRDISEQLNKFEILRLSGNVTMSSPIKLPKSEPFAILDTSGAYTKLTTQRVLITRDRIFFRPFFTTYQVKTEELKDLKSNREEVKTFLAMLVFFLLPSIIFYTYLAIWLKYALLILFLSIILYVALDLTHWRRTWNELVVIACYTSTLPVLAEVILGAVNARWLVPVLNIAGLVTLYLVPIVLLTVLTIGAALCVYSNKKEEQ